MKRNCIQKESGYTLIEVIVAMGILATVISYSSVSFVTHLSANHRGEIRSEAAQAAQTVIDELRGEEVGDLPQSGSSPSRDIQVNDNRTFKVDVAYCTDSSLCAIGSARHLDVEVTYREEVVYRTETVFTALSASSNSSSTSGP